MQSVLQHAYIHVYMYTSVAYRLDSVPYPQDQFVLFSHVIDKLHRNEARVIGTGELLC